MCLQKTHKNKAQKHINIKEKKHKKKQLQNVTAFSKILFIDFLPFTKSHCFHNIIISI